VAGLEVVAQQELVAFEGEWAVQLGVLEVDPLGRHPAQHPHGLPVIFGEMSALLLAPNRQQHRHLQSPNLLKNGLLTDIVMPLQEMVHPQLKEVGLRVQLEIVVVQVLVESALHEYWLLALV
jgi:hypothetical protein